MAKVTSGSFNTSRKNNRYLTFSWTCEQDIQKNQSTINWKLTCGGSASGYNTSAPFQVMIDGVQVYYSTTRINLYVGDTIATGSKVLNHNSKGARSFSASVKGAIYDITYNVNGSASWDLKDIPRGATINSAPHFTDEDSPTITFTNHLGNSVDELAVGISFTKSQADIPYRAISKTATSYTFNFTEEEIAKLQAHCNDDESKIVYYYTRVKYGDSYYYSNAATTLRIVNAEPTIDSFTVVDVKPETVALTGGGNKMIIGNNKMYCVATATTRKGAEIVDSYIAVNNIDGNLGFEGLEGYIENADAPKFSAMVVDTRYKIGQNTYELEGINYIPLTCNVEAEIRLDTTTGESAEIEFTISGNFFNQSFGAKQNQLQLQVNFTGDSGGTSTEILTIPEDAYDGNTYELTLTREGFNYKDIWIVSATAKDSLDTTGVTSTSKRLSALPVFDWSKEDFNFNVPIKYHGVPIAYEAGDSITIPGTYAFFAGTVANNGKQILFTIPIGKPIMATGATFSGSVTCRSSAGYIGKDANDDGTIVISESAIDISNKTDTSTGLINVRTRMSECGITVILDFSAELDNILLYNTPLIATPNGDLTITFT